MISWLLKADLSSAEHQLARYIVSNLNWGHVGEVKKFIITIKFVKTLCKGSI